LIAHELKLADIAQFAFCKIIQIG